MKLNLLMSVFAAVAMLCGFGSSVAAQSVTPNVQVAEMGIVDGTVNIVEAAVTGPGWVVIHADDEGSPGPVIGYAPLEEGVTSDVTVEIDADAATPILHAMLHVDEGTVGTFEFPGPDAPVTIGDSVVMARFSAEPVLDAEEEAPAPATVPVTGAAMPTPLILLSVAAVMSVLTVSALVTRRWRG